MPIIQAKAKIKLQQPVVDHRQSQDVDYDSDSSEKTINTEEYPKIYRIEDIEQFVCNLNFEEKLGIIKTIANGMSSTEISKLQKQIDPKESASTLFEKQFLASFGFSVGKGGLNKRDILESLSVEYRKRIDDKKHEKGKTKENNNFMRELLKQQLKVQNPKLFQELETKHECHIQKQMNLLSKENSKSTNRSNTNQSKANNDKIKALMQNTNSDSDSD